MKNILHRDIKPENMFLPKENQVKIGDFGLTLELNKTTSGLNAIVGTFKYTAPE